MGEFSIAIICVALGVLLLFFAHSRAEERRAQELKGRPRVDIVEWKRACPGLADDELVGSLKVLSKSLNVDPEYLHPDDRFDHDLRLKGSLLIDEDVAEDVRLDLVDRFGGVWSGEWEIASEAIVEIAKKCNTGSC